MERGMEVARPFAGKVHRAQRVLKPGVLRRGEDPPRALQLMDAAQALQPRGIHQVLLRGLTRDAARPALRDAKVSVDGIGGQVDARVFGAGLIHHPIIAVTPLLAEGIELFNHGRYWDAHEVWEREWTPDRKGADSGFYKGLIQVAAGCLHYSRHNRRRRPRRRPPLRAGFRARACCRDASAPPAAGPFLRLRQAPHRRDRAGRWRMRPRTARARRHSPPPPGTPRRQPRRSAPPRGRPAPPLRTTRAWPRPRCETARAPSV